MVLREANMTCAFLRSGKIHVTVHPFLDAREQEAADKEIAQMLAEEDRRGGG